MNIFEIALIIGAAVTALISFNLPHALMWIFLAGVNAVACDLFYAYDLPYPAAFTLACDCLLCLSIHWLAQERWEIALYVIYLISVLVSLCKLTKILADWYIYSSLLEACNWLALLLITGTAILGMVGASGNYFHRSWRAHVRSAYSYLRLPRKTPHWSRVK